MRRVHFWIICSIVVTVAACSTERNTFISRSYHSTTAHYNGYFNANDLLNQALTTYRSGLKEDFYQALTIRPLPTEEEVKNMYAPIDTAISKCTKVIQNHAMPSMDKPAAKKEEHNTWIDENWTTIGVANYYRRDYEVAEKNFEYVQRFYAKDKSTYIAQMWMARTFIEQGKFTEANFCINNLEKAKEEAENGGDKSDKKSKSKLSKSKKKKEKEAKVDPFPKKLNFDLFLTKAIFAEKKKDRDKEIEALVEALKYAKKSSDKARINFILGQLTEAKGDRGAASAYYGKTLKYNAGYEMSFNARMKRALNSGGEKVKQDLKRLLRDPKNAEFKDQIYYTLGLIAQQEGDAAKAKDDYTSSALFSVSNNRQKGMAYERLGDMSFSNKDYVSAQKYYDSCGAVIPPTYPNYEGIKQKASRLQQLVDAVETASKEDSLQRIAGLGESERYAFAEKVIEKIKKDEAARKVSEAKRLEALQAIQAKSESNTGNGNKWYFNNAKTKQEGFEEFKRIWGQIENEDDWRRSEKVSFATFKEPGSDTVPTVSEPTVENTATDSLTPEILLADVPLSDSSLAMSRDKMMSAYFEAGKIYQDLLKEDALAEGQYMIIINKPFESDYKLLAAFQIYRLYDPSDAKAIVQRDYILTNYPTSDYAGFLRDPEYFIKKKERDKLTEQEYLVDLSRYERGLYYPVVTKADLVIKEQKDNPFRAKYMLLKANAEARLNADKKTVLPTLNDLIASYPGTPEAKKAREMKDIIEKGYSKNEAVDFTDKSIYKYEEKVPLQVIIYLDENVNLAVAKTRIVDFNKEFFSRGKLKTTSKILGDKNVIVVAEFESEEDARAYYNMYKKTRKHLLDMQKFKVVYISLENMKTLFLTQKIQEYELFFDENY